MERNRIAPFFIVSSGRAGTTLLCALLNASGEVHIPPESDFIARAYPFYNHRSSFTEEDYRKLSRIFFKTSQSAWKLDEATLFNVLKEKKPQSFGEINSLIYNTFLMKANAGKAQWGIKRPVLIASIDRIRSVFPDAKIIHIVRDGRDVALSYKSVHDVGQKFGPKSIFTCALYWADGLKRIDEVSGNFVLEIRYEDLLTDTDNTLKSICRFIDIEHNVEKFENYQNSNKNTLLTCDTHNRTIHKKVKEGIDTSNINKYRYSMPKMKKIMFELLAAPYLIKYKYELEYSFLGASIWGVIRFPLYLASRLFNNLRYARRDRLIYKSI